MAGGRGERLRPLTDTTPKPMLEIDGMPIIEHTIRRLKKVGITNIFISINYLGQQIINHFGHGESIGVNIRYLQENEPLGTLGSLSLLPEVEHQHLLILNSDILTDINFQDFFECYINTKSYMCVASIPYHMQVPYAVLQVTDENIMSFVEKPSYNFHSNAGIYLLKKDLKDKIPLATFYNTTDLMASLIEEQAKVTHYPHLGYWLDIGQHADYKKAQEDIKRIRL
jgi:NDP-sugar pyrophosphorylase family protein